MVYNLESFSDNSSDSLSPQDTSESSARQVQTTNFPVLSSTVFVGVVAVAAVQAVYLLEVGGCTPVPFCILVAFACVPVLFVEKMSWSVCAAMEWEVGTPVTHDVHVF